MQLCSFILIAVWPLGIALLLWTRVHEFSFKHLLGVCLGVYAWVAWMAVLRLLFWVIVKLFFCSGYTICPKTQWQLFENDSLCFLAYWHILMRRGAAVVTVCTLTVLIGSCFLSRFLIPKVWRSDSEWIPLICSLPFGSMTFMTWSLSDTGFWDLASDVAVWLDFLGACCRLGAVA